MSILSAEQKAKDILERAWDGNFPVDPLLIAERLSSMSEAGCIDMVGANNNELNGASGMAEFVDASNKKHFKCSYNASEAMVRQRFTQAHELGHVVLAHVDEKTPRMRDERFDNRNGIEIDANAFAAELLMPSRWLPALLKQAESFNELTRTLGVSAVALRYRLKNLGLL
jgi:Zn-dependent peptidase ImmA (M78 family)